jgi:arylsulfatase A-like enzyme
MTPRLLLVLALCVAGTLAPRTSLAGASRPNIVVMLIDDMGVMDTSLPFLPGANGQPERHPLNEFYRTPNMERLAARGIRFNQFCAMSVCSPTRISIMTGQNAARHRTTNWIYPDKDNAGAQGAVDWNWRGVQPGAVTLPALLGKAGYRTIHVGKGHFGPRHEPGSDPSKIGFDVNVGGASIGQPGSYYGTKNYGNAIGGKGGGSGVPGLEKYHGTETFLTDALTLEANAHMEAAVKESKPFFLYLAHYAVHAPFNADPRFADHYKDSGKPAAAQAFATLIEGMDKSLGDVLDQLEKLGVAQDTLFFFLGDNGSDAPLGAEHGVACAAPLRGKKATHYEGGMRVPFIAAWAKPDPSNPLQKRLPITQGAVQGQLAAVYDLFPTALAAARVQSPAEHVIDGRALDPLLTGVRDPQRDEMFLMHYPHAHRSSYFTAYRHGEWKVVYHYLPTEKSGGGHYQLFHLASDPYEQKDLASEKPAELRRMMQELTAGLESQNAAYPRDAEGKVLKPLVP